MRNEKMSIVAREAIDTAKYALTFENGKLVDVKRPKYHIKPTELERSRILAGHSVAYDIEGLGRIALQIADLGGKTEVDLKGGRKDIFLKSDDLKYASTVVVGDFLIEYEDKK